MKRTDWLWAGALGLLLLVGSGLLPDRHTDEEVNSYSASFGGKKAFFDLVHLLFQKVERNSERLLPPEGGSTLLIIGPAQYPDRVQWQMLYDWVVDGHTLIFAARWHDPALELRPFGVRIERRWGLPPEAEEEGGDEDPPQPSAEGLETDLVEGELDWMSQGHIVVPVNSAQVEVSLDGKAQVTSHKVGKGLLIVVSSDYIFCNVSLARGDNGLLAFRILELAGPQGAVYFDEWLNASGPPKVVGLLFDDPLRPLTVQLLIFAVLLAWQGNRRFGPPERERVALRRSLTEHAAALGNLHYKVGSGGRSVGAYLEYFRHELRLHYSKADEATTLAERAGARTETVRQLIHQALRAAKNPRLAPSHAARLVRSLAALKHEAEHWKGAPNGN